MNWTAAGLVVGVLVGSGGIGSMVVIFFKPKRAAGVRENDLIDQYQEQVTELRSEVAELKRESERKTARESLMIQHVWELHQHIVDQKPPPPPPFPPGLLGGLP